MNQTNRDMFVRTSPSDGHAISPCETASHRAVTAKQTRFTNGASAARELLPPATSSSSPSSVYNTGEAHGMPAREIRRTRSVVAGIGIRGRRWHLIVLLSLLLGTCASSALAQTPVGTPVAFGDVAVSGSLRTRSYSWDWFGGSANGDYTYPGSLARL